MNQQTLYVGFDGHQVAVHSKTPEVLAGLRRSFREMLKAESMRTVGRLQVHRKGEKYHLLGDSEVSVESGSLSNIFQHLNYRVVLHLIRARCDLLWLHAGVAACEGSAVVISGVSGRGKSTLVTNLCANGWTYLSDDVIPLEPNLGRAFPFPQTPAVREDPGREIPSERLPELRKTMVDLKPEMVCREPVPIGAVVFPVYCYGCRTELLPCTPATAALELLQNCLNFPSHREAAVRYLCDLVKHVPTFRLTYSGGKLAAELIARAHEKKWCVEKDLAESIG